ncbi:MAG: hypothetical protein OEU55_15570, partial [Desulfobacterales bacterium]|nr:hypothetical protein [Desulfobacterales bacterium]
IAPGQAGLVLERLRSSDAMRMLRLYTRRRIGRSQCTGADRARSSRAPHRLERAYRPRAGKSVCMHRRLRSVVDQ